MIPIRPRIILANAVLWESAVMMSRYVVAAGLAAVPSPQ
jgi:hypothetical protein